MFFPPFFVQFLEQSILDVFSFFVQVLEQSNLGLASCGVLGRLILWLKSCERKQLEQNDTKNDDL